MLGRFYFIHVMLEVASSLFHAVTPKPLHWPNCMSIVLQIWICSLIRLERLQGNADKTCQSIAILCVFMGRAECLTTVMRAQQRPCDNS